MGKCRKECLAWLADLTRDLTIVEFCRVCRISRTAIQLARVSRIEFPIPVELLCIGDPLAFDLHCPLPIVLYSTAEALGYRSVAGTLKRF